MGKCKRFPSKVLLFGEYSIIKNSMALSIPYELFDGELLFNPARTSGVDSELKAFCEYLKSIDNDSLPFQIDITSFDFDIGQGLVFDSTIPQGFGVGSSGALCAAVFNRYGCNFEKSKNTKELKSIFSIMESHFHGSSSGVDPLISYLNQPILINDNREIEEISLPDYLRGEGGVFLLNTGRSRRTEPLVNLFLEKCKTKEFDSLCKNILLPVTNNCIISFLEHNTPDLYRSFRELSDFQYKYFNPMIPKLFEEIWLKGIRSESFYLKLCGAGGGGFILGITKNFKDAKEALAGHEIRPLFRF